jgi:tetratricopeptide (TPR) repeat protein
MKLRLFALATASFTCAISPSFAQHHHGPPTNQGSETLVSGLSALHHPIATTNEEAQRFFDQGLAFVYAFNHNEAIRSFERAAELDPRSPMPYWGKALALGPNYNETEPGREQAAYDTIQKAKALSASAPENERAYVEALALRFSNDPKPDFDRLARAYAAAMRELSRRYLDDPDAATLYAESLMDLHAWDLWTSDGKPGENTSEIVSVLEGVLRRWPDHIGANHFYIHTVEASPKAELGLPSAQRLETLAPAAGHLVHMPAHIYIRTGDYVAAVKSNEQAVAADDAFHRAHPATNSVYSLSYGAHNIHFLAAAAMMDGDFETADKAAKQLESRVRPALAEMPMVEGYLTMPVFVLVRFGRWDDVLTLPQPDAKLTGLSFVWHYARGCAHAAKGNAAQADAEREAMESASKQLPDGQAFGMLYNDWKTLDSLATHTLDARIAAARGDLPLAIEKWRAAVAVQDQMHYDEPPDWYYPVRESLGAALLRGGRAADAEQVFREDLQRNPRNPRSLYGLQKSLEAQNKLTDAQWVQASFESAWKGGAEAPHLADY